ncbi:MAG: TIM barrel protein [Armatimonadia bacterium]|nr:TIM barrel protein [Armatimonadia bacterium]
MRLGAPVFGEVGTPELWAKAHLDKGYGAAYCPIGGDADDATAKAYADAAGEAGLIIAEVGAWSNPISPDEATRSAAMDNCKRQLDLAERIGARCCVNIAGSVAEQWDGPDNANMTPGTFDLIVASVQEIIDAVSPQRTFYTLECMPYMYPTCADDCESLIRAIDRPQFAVHFDPVNMINSPYRYYGSGAFVTDFVERLGDRIRSCHAKDIIIRPQLTLHLDECGPGEGNLDYPALLTALSKLDADTPLMVEHLQTPEQYDAAIDHIRRMAGKAGVAFV